MPRKTGINTKAEESRERKAGKQAEKAVKQMVEKEDQYWQEAGDGKKTKAQQKREEDEARRKEAAAKRQEAKLLAEEEARELAKVAAKTTKAKTSPAVPKVTQAELARQKEKEQQEQAAAAKVDKRTTNEREYDLLVNTENTNREEALVDATSVDQALEQMSMAESSPGAPERRMKAAYKAFEELELPRLKVSRPGLALTQYKDLLWKQWKKSPANPLNQQG